MRIALTGGTGFVGESLIAHALAERHDISGLARVPQTKRVAVNWHQGDLSDKGALLKLVADAEVVIHLAGAVRSRNPATFEEVNVNGTLNLVEACAMAGIGRFILVSSLAAREPEVSAYGASKARAEKIVMASGLDWTIVRPPAVYGPGDREMLDVFRAAKWGLVPTPRAGSASVIHVDDLARLLLNILPGGDEVTSVTFEPDDGKFGGWSHHELARAIGIAMGTQPKTVGLSRKVMELAARIDCFFRRDNAKLTPDRAAYLSHPDWVVGEGAKPPPWLWEPRIETPDGLKATANWYREQGWA